MRALKLLVVVLGVLIVIGLGGLVATVAGRMANKSAPAGASGAAPVAFGRSVILVPAGATLVSVEGAGDRLVARLELPGGEQQLVVIDLGTGKALGTLELVPQK
jgi:flagellar basal body-associated protein FliL